MRIKLICIIVLLSMGMMSWTHAQSYDRLWKQVEQAQQKSLPQTVVRLTGEIYQKAKAEKNSPQMLKAYIWQMKFREEITPDSLRVVEWLRAVGGDYGQAIGPCNPAFAYR